jgi:hypothetical protein
VSLFSELRESGNERGGLCNDAASRPALSKGGGGGRLGGGDRALSAPPRHGLCNVAASRPAFSSGEAAEDLAAEVVR